jgi:3-hydroxybutyryl-CoA dehydrogenase
MSKKIIENLNDFALSKENVKANPFFTKVGIVGCGKEGQNIACVAARNGFEVVFIELSEEKIEAAYEGIKSLIDDIINQWGLTKGDKRNIMSRIKGSTDYKDLAGCDIVIESIRANRGQRRSVQERKDVFKMIEKHVSKDTVIATNTATIIVTELSSELEHKDRCLGLFFYIASSESRFVEIVKGLYTSDEVCDKTKQFILQLNRKTVKIQETAGLIGVRMITMIINEACEIFMQGIADKEAIDESLRVAHGMRMGPFAQADKIGLHKIDRWLEDMYNDYGQVKYKPNPLLKQLVRANHLGVETREGFYKYDEAGNKVNA